MLQNRSTRLALGILLGCAGLFATEGQAQAISRDEVLARAQPWLNVVPYCQAPNGGYDADCGVTCKRPPNPSIDAWRSDCSGYVSYAWGLPAPGKVVSGLVAVSHDISASELKPGDALASSGHIMLFVGWVDGQSKVKIWHEGDCGQTALEKIYTVNSISGGTISVWDTFQAIRFNEISDTPDWQATFEAQSWAPAGTPIPMTVGETKTGWIKLKNTGGKTWPAGVVKLAPIPRDAASPLAAPSWPSPTRVSSIASDVKPGESAQLEWDLTATKAGDSQPYFGVVAEGVTWFADAGGPSDKTIHIDLHVQPAAGAGGASAKGGAAGAGGTSAGGAKSAGGATGLGAAAGHAGSAGKAAGGKSGATNAAGGATTDGAGGNGGGLLTGSGGTLGDDTGETESSGGCATSTRPASPWAFAGWLVAIGLAARRRGDPRRARRSPPDA